MNRRTLLKLAALAPLAPKTLVTVPAPSVHRFDDNAIRETVKRLTPHYSVYSYSMMIPISAIASKFLDRGAVPMDLHFEWLDRARAGGDEGTAYYNFLMARYLRAKNSPTPLGDPGL